MIRRLGRPLVHGSWHRAWWQGDAAWTELLGPPATDEVLAGVAARLTPGDHWHQALAPASRDRPAPPAEALVVLAGQQPVLAGGAALVAHKAAQAIALARELEARWGRPVVPVFLLATQDHDTGEVDHVDTFDHPSGSLVRYRCPITPSHEMFSRSGWHGDQLRSSMTAVVGAHGAEKVLLDEHEASLDDHVARMLDATFGAEGLRLIQAHRLADAAQPLLGRALAEPEAHSQLLDVGARRLRALGRAPAFDPQDPRPLVLESRDGRRRRLEPGDQSAAERLAARPDDFSPHAALRPIVQARCLPVVAQVCGPSEILYLGQARGLHVQHDVTAPALVPRLEATRLPDDLDPGLDDAELLDLLDLRREAPEPLARLQALEQALDDFRRGLTADEPWMAARVERFAAGALRGARRLAEAPLWQRRGILGASQRIHPRGRYQDTTLAWAPDAFAAGRPAAWGAFITDLCAPTTPPEHVAYTLPETLRHG